MTAVGQICHDLRRRDVLWVFAQIEKFAQLKMRRKTHTIIIHDHSCFIQSKLQCPILGHFREVLTIENLSKIIDKMFT